MAQWITYKNTLYTFSIGYPKDWSLDVPFVDIHLNFQTHIYIHPAPISQKAAHQS